MVEIESMKNFPIIIESSLVARTLESLRKAGERNSEGIVLWLGRRGGDGVSVAEPYVPVHEADYDYFHIPGQAMSDLLAHLGNTRTFIAAQVHSHPKTAFHSVPDGKWAIVRHEGALSLVVPYFARKTTASNFLDHIAAFQLSRENIWEELSAVDLTRWIQIT